MGTAPTTAWAGHEVSLWCRTCDERVILYMAPGLPAHLARAVHAATGDELGPDGHLAAPVSTSPAQRASEEASA